MTQRTFHIGMNGVARITQEVGPFLPVNCSMSSAHGVLLKEDNGNIGKSEMIFVECTLSDTNTISDNRVFQYYWEKTIHHAI